MGFILQHPLTRDRRLDAIRRFARWQIGSRLLPGAIVYDWVNNSRFLVRRGETGLTGNVYAGLHEFAEMGYLLHALRSDELFVDVGANMGAYTILACAAVGARGYAFEPVPSTYTRLLENIRLNHLDGRVKCVNKGVAACAGWIDFTSDADAMNHALAPGERDRNTVSVEVTSLDTDLADERPSILKIDVEGYEALVLEGAAQTLKCPALHSIIIELNGSGSRYGFDEPKIVRRLLEDGFSAYSYDPFSRTLARLQYKNEEAGNTLFIRDPALIAERVRAAPKASVFGREF